MSANNASVKLGNRSFRRLTTLVSAYSQNSTRRAHISQDLPPFPSCRFPPFLICSHRVFYSLLSTNQHTIRSQRGLTSLPPLQLLLHKSLLWTLSVVYGSYHQRRNLRLDHLSRGVSSSRSFDEPDQTSPERPVSASL
jgi:hypothetical protein